jgi:hypothetical protein
VQGANSWLDDFEHGLTNASLNGTGYRIFENPSLDQSKESAGAKVHPSLTFRHANHWMADVRTATEPGGERNGYGGTYLRPDRTFRFENGKLVVEFDYAAGVLPYGGNNWAEVVITTAPKPDHETLGFTITDTDGFSNFRGHWTFAYKLQPSRELRNFVINDNTDPATLKRPDYDRHLHAVMSAFQPAGADEVFGGGPYTTATDRAWRTCQGTDPDLNCRDRFRVELSKDTITHYVNGTRYMEHKGLPPDKQLPEELLNADLYVYFVSWVYRNGDDVETVRFHWDRIAINPSTGPSAAPGFGQPPAAPAAPAAPAPGAVSADPHAGHMMPAEASAARAPLGSASQAPAPPEAMPAAGAAALEPGTVTFDDQAGENRALNGGTADGLIDFGSGEWYLSGPWQALSTKSISFTDGATRATLRISAPRRLTSVLAYNGGQGESQVTLSCSGAEDPQASAAVTIAPGRQATLATGWEAPCAAVTVTSSNGWDTNFDNLVLAPAAG